MQNCPLLLGHRGVRDHKTIRENTPAAFDFALAQGCNGFEFDVRLTKDGEAVICHDEMLGRLRVAACPAKRLQLPSLREVLARYRSGAFLDIELKVTGLEKIAIALLHEFPPERGLVVSSFLPPVLQEFRDLDRVISLGLICETHSQFARWSELPVEYIILQSRLFKERLLSQALSQIRKAGKKILVWTVNQPAAMREFAERGVDGIISDSPQKLAATLGRRGKVQN